jgi:hypothetical protein
MLALPQISACRCTFVVPRLGRDLSGPHLFRGRFDDEDDDTDDDWWNPENWDAPEDEDEFDPEPTTDGGNDEFDWDDDGFDETEPPPDDLWNDADWE